MVIKALSDGLTHVPFRDSRLTRILTDSLGKLLIYLIIVIVCLLPLLSHTYSHYLQTYWVSYLSYFILCHPLRSLQVRRSSVVVVVVVVVVRAEAVCSSSFLSSYCTLVHSFLSYFFLITFFVLPSFLHFYL